MSVTAIDEYYLQQHAYSVKATIRVLLMEENQTSRLNRRNFVKLGTAGGALALAGCLGGGGSDEEVINISTSGDDSGVFAASQGLASVVNEHADNVTIDATPGDGAAGSMGEVERAEADVGYTENWATASYINGEEPYDEFESQLQMLFHCFSFITPYGTNNPEWETIEDVMESDGTPTGFLTPPGSASLQANVRAFEELGYYEGEDYEIANIGFGDAASAMNEGRIDFSVVLLFNMDPPPSYMQQLLSQNDVHLLSWAEENIDAANSIDGVNVRMQDFSEFSDMFSSYDEDEYPAFFADYNYVTAEGLISSEGVYDMMTALHENRDELADIHPYLEGAREDESYWVQQPLTQLPFHPGMADFLQDNDLWDDAWEVGNE